MTPTGQTSYAERLNRLQNAWWKRLLDVQRPYRLHLRRLKLGLVLEIGCGIGRNLAAFGEGAAVGIDQDPEAVRLARGRGLTAFTPEEFRASRWASAERFDALLLSHVLEHMSRSEALGLVRESLGWLRPGGRVVIETPQEAGFRSDGTHVEFMDAQKVEGIVREAGLQLLEQYSFPFPRAVGKLFRYNQFVSIAKMPGGAGSTK